MTAISTWSTTAASNNSASPDGAPEGMAPGGVNDTIRENMAQVRAFYDSIEWRDLNPKGIAATYVSGTSFKSSGTDTTAVYTVGRRVHANGSGTGDIYGEVLTSTFSTDTTVTLAWDSGSLSNEAITVEVGLSADNNPVGGSMPSGAITAYAGAAAPAGWLLCDGTAYNGTTSPIYAKLHAAIGNTYGGADITDFQVPDLTGRTIAGHEAGGESRITTLGSGIDGGSLGAAGGDEDMDGHTHTGPSHTHTGPSHTHTGPSHTHTGPLHGHALRVSSSAGSIDAGLTGGVGFTTEATISTNAAFTGTASSSSGEQLGGSGTGATGASGTGATGASGTGATGASGTGASGSTGAGSSGNVQPVMILNWIIKV